MTADKRIERLIFRSGHRGTREMDLLLGSFAAAHLRGFTPAQLDAYEALLQCGDPDLYEWITGKTQPPPAYDNEVTRMLCQHRFKA